MALKQTWQFKYQAEAVLAGAHTQLEYHERKTAEWLKREGEREAEAQRSITMGEGYVTVEGRSTVVAQPKYDDAKMSALYEAQAHRKEHQAKADQYRTWVNVLTVQPEHLALALDYDDVVFFGLAEAK